MTNAFRQTGPASAPLAVLAALLAFAAGPSEADRTVFHDRADGATCRHFDRALDVLWSEQGLAGLDATGQPEGPDPFASLTVGAGDASRVWRLDVTPLVLAWWRGQLPNDGLLLRLLRGDPVRLHAREFSDAALRPQLELTFAGGKKRYIEAAADVSLDCSTYQGLGQAPSLVLMQDAPLAIRFALPQDRPWGEPVTARLVIVREPSTPRPASLAVLRMPSPLGDASTPPQPGLASRYPMDRGIDADPQVVFADGFDNGRLNRAWSTGMAAPYRVVATDRASGFVPVNGQALRVRIPAGGQLGLDLRYRFKQHLGSEPESIHLRYYLRLAPDWLQATQGGKLPGLAGTYGKAGWGGRHWDGNKGWSMRGAYYLPAASGHPAAGRIMLGSYGYHSDASTYGQNLSWHGAGLAGLIAPNQWVCIEQYLQLNAPGRSDGVFKVWIDGRLALERAGMRFRDRSDIRIEEAWMNVFHGGTAAVPVDLHAFIDNVVIAREYIGPMVP